MKQAGLIYASCVYKYTNIKFFYKSIYGVCIKPLPLIYIYIIARRFSSIFYRLKSKIPQWERSGGGSQQSSGIPTPKESQSPKDGKAAANPQQLAQALRRLSTKPGGARSPKTPPSIKVSEEERRKSRDMPEVKGYDESRRTSLNDLESRIQRLSSSQQKSMKDLRKLSLKLESAESKSSGSEKTTQRKQAHFVLPSSKKFDKSPASTLSASVGSSSRRDEKREK